MVYKALMASPVGTPVSFDIQDWHLPAFVTASGRTIQVTLAKLALKTAAGVALGGVQLAVDDQPVGAFAADQSKTVVGGLPAVSLPGTFKICGKHTLVVTAPAGLAPNAPTVGDVSAIDRQKLVAVLLYVEYHVTVP